ncbi:MULTISPECIES: carbon starvation CstA family protein [Paenibacillus]|uniref:Carbon starvation protein CstA n=2 Tax=Paenibacillus lactis TaxID=228574 RepID=G4HGQ5_9BACL|nr:carbon starvation CstA family protein [Paenibacillus lactis]EHB63928.1 carbon starvation protein CstA [Paenibacillus lactis 154]MBP1894948.1 carbon starvation protein CstA [Paenibacillus lactis]MCM3491816.1 carbon starvation protein A [Paenibacillus lactis]HAF96816.1 carbon starvation protein A [Paenibacillus lactis]
MITFIVSILLLILGYFTYGKYIEKLFGVKEERSTPAYVNQDGVDYLPMSTGKNSLIQLLNIAGVGPIFGPIMGALYGPVAFLWIVFGCIFAGAVHDYLTGMISIRNRGAHLPELAGKFLGKVMKHVVNAFAILLLILVGTVFVTSPASLLHNLMNGSISLWMITVAIFGYYILATLLPIDKIIGRFYPIFGALLLIASVGVGAMLIIQKAPIPELTFTNMHPDNLPIFPLLFLTITCGALSGFHATQTPIISRTTQREGQGRKIFYGMMIAEGIIAMVWAAAAMSLFHGSTGLNELLATGGTGLVVSEVAKVTLGAVVGTFAVLGVIVLPITSGDTAFRSARMIIADYIKLPQLSMKSRLLIAVPLFFISIALTQIDFNILWRYFSWANQATGVIALFVGAMYLYIARKNFWVALIPGAMMLYTTTVYILNAQIGFRLSMNASYIVGAVISAVLVIIFFKAAQKARAAKLPLDVDVSGFNKAA